MRYLSFDIEATGLEEDALIIEFGMVPFDTDEKKVYRNFEKHFYIQCPSFLELEPNLNPWVIENNKELINIAHKQGISKELFKQELETYLGSTDIKDFFNNEKIMLFGKSISAIDLPFLNRDLGWDWMNRYFHHRNLDLSCFTLGLIDMGKLEKGMDSGSNLMSYLGMGEVCHTALEDAINTAEMYLKLLDRI